jgi:hypothetical protein
MVNSPDVLPDIISSLHTWILAYYFWTIVFAVLAVLAIAMPLIAASALFAHTAAPAPGAAVTLDKRRIAIGLIGGIAAALLTGLRPNEYASGFDAAQAALGSAVINFRANNIDTKQLASEYQKARNLTVFRYTGPNLGGK